MHRHPAFPRALAVVLFLASAGAYAAEIEWLPSWKPHDKVAYEVTRCKPVKVSGKPVDTCAKGRLDIEVLRADANGSLQRWTSDPLREALASGGLSAEADAALREAVTFSMDIEFDEAAQPVRLVNAEELRAKLRAVYRMRPLVEGAKAPDPKALATAEAFIEKLIGTDERLLSLMAKDAQILYAPLGGSFPLGEALRVDSSMPSPFGSTPLRSTLSVTAKAEGPASEELELEVLEDLDRKSLIGFLDDIVKPLVLASGKPEAAAEMKAALSSMTLRRNSLYKIRRQSSWPLQVSHRQLVELGEQSRLEVTEFRRAP